MSLSIRSAPQDENAHAARTAPAKGGLAARGGLQQQGAPLKPQQAASVGKGGAPTEKRRALGDITNSSKLGGGGSGGLGGGLKGKPLQSSVVASTRPLAAPPASRQATKLSAPIQLVSTLAAPLPSASSSDLRWMEVEGAKGDGRRPACSDEDELAVAASRALLRVMPQGKDLFTCRPQSPIPWERTQEEDAYNGPSHQHAGRPHSRATGAMLTEKLPSPADFADIDDFDLQF